MEPLCWFLHKRETFVTVVVCYEGIRVIALILLKTVADCLRCMFDVAVLCRLSGLLKTCFFLCFL